MTKVYLNILIVNSNLPGFNELNILEIQPLIFHSKSVRNLIDEKFFAKYKYLGYLGQKFKNNEIYKKFTISISMIFFVM